MVEGINKILNPYPLGNQIISYGVLAVGVVFEGLTWLVALREFRGSKGQRRWIDAIKYSTFR
ncbi:hypothetical protein [Acidisoma cellulosilyticum]|uniref:hypothetical protein n=1 Tax=Acidisoma cellulosilyticum TaxID=2802395 RepID=UPI001D0A8DA8|nr:hypothetical protein [Acidisoma cellulosilyticum]